MTLPSRPCKQTHEHSPSWAKKVYLLLVDNVIAADEFTGAMHCGQSGGCIAADQPRLVSFWAYLRPPQCSLRVVPLLMLRC